MATLPYELCGDDDEEAMDAMHSVMASACQDNGDATSKLVGFQSELAPRLVAACPRLAQPTRIHVVRMHDYYWVGMAADLTHLATSKPALFLREAVKAVEGEVNKAGEAYKAIVVGRWRMNVKANDVRVFQADDGAYHVLDGTVLAGAFQDAGAVLSLDDATIDQLVRGLAGAMTGPMMRIINSLPKNTFYLHPKRATTRATTKAGKAGKVAPERAPPVKRPRSSSSAVSPRPAKRTRREEAAVVNVVDSSEEEEEEEEEDGEEESAPDDQESGADEEEEEASSEPPTELVTYATPPHPRGPEVPEIPAIRLAVDRAIEMVAHLDDPRVQVLIRAARSVTALHTKVMGALAEALHRFALAVRTREHLVATASDRRLADHVVGKALQVVRDRARQVEVEVEAAGRPPAFLDELALVTQLLGTTYKYEYIALFTAWSAAEGCAACRFPTDMDAACADGQCLYCAGRASVPRRAEEAAARVFATYVGLHLTDASI